MVNAAAAVVDGDKRRLCSRDNKSDDKSLSNMYLDSSFRLGNNHQRFKV